MGVSTPEPKDSPLMVAWEAYKATPEYENTKRWALHPSHVDGSLWAAFSEGFRLRVVPASGPEESMVGAVYCSRRVKGRRSCQNLATHEERTGDYRGNTWALRCDEHRKPADFGRETRPLRTKDSERTHRRRYQRMCEALGRDPGSVDAAIDALCALASRPAVPASGEREGDA